MMYFRIITQALIDLLGATAAGRYVVVGYQNQGTSAAEVKDNKRQIQVYYSDGTFKSITTHSMSFTIGLSVSAASRMDLTVLSNPASTPTQIGAAMASMQDAAYRADRQFDDLVEIIYQTLMDLRYYDLNLPIGSMADRFVDSINKDAPQPQGELVMLTGAMHYTCKTVETLTGEIGVSGTGGVDTQIDQVGDDVERAGVIAIPRPASIIDGQLFDVISGALLYDSETGAPIIVGDI